MPCVQLKLQAGLLFHASVAQNSSLLLNSEKNKYFYFY